MKETRLGVTRARFRAQIASGAGCDRCAVCIRASAAARHAAAGLVSGGLGLVENT